MTVDTFFSTIAKVAGWILPVLGIVVLIYLILILRELLVTLKSATKTLTTTEEQIRKLDVPLQTAENLSRTVDEVHEITKKAVKSTASFLVSNLDQLKNWFHQKNSNVPNDVDDSFLSASEDIKEEESI